MSKKPKGNKQQHHPADAHAQEGRKLDDKPSRVHIDGGKIETNFPPELIKKHETTTEQQERWEHKKFRAEIITVVLLFIYTTVAMWQGCTARSEFKLAQMGQRAWISIGDIYPKPGFTPTERKGMEVGRPLWIHIIWRNSGPTPALYVTASVKQDIIRTENPEFIDSDRLGSDVWNKMPQGALGVFDPNTTDTYGDITITDSLLQSDYDDIINGKLHVFIIGRIDYCDVYDRQHWMTFCRQMLPTNAIAVCKNFNEIDPQEKDAKCSLKPK